MVKGSKFRFYYILPVLFMLMALTVHPVYATENPGDGIVGAGEVIDDDVILDAENPQMLGTVNGMLIILGNHALVDGTVNGDVFAIGNYVEFGKNAHVTGNVFSAGYIISMSGQIDGSNASAGYSSVYQDGSSIGRNMYSGAFSTELKPESTVAMDVYIGAYQAMLDGTIGRDLNIGGGYIGLTGSVGRNALIEVGAPGVNEPAPFAFSSMTGQNENLPAEAKKLIPTQRSLGLEISESAVIGGKLTYVSPLPQTDTVQVKPSGGTVYQTPVPDPESQQTGQQPVVFQHAEKGTAAFVAGIIITWVWTVLKAFITLLLVALLVFWLVPRPFEQSLQMLKDKPARSFGFGILAIAGGFILLFFSLVVLVCFTAFLGIITFGTLGFYFFLISFSCYFLVFALFLLLSLVVSKILVAYFVGEWLLGKLSKTPVQGRAIPLILGLVLFIILGYVPFLGFIVRSIMTVFGTGAIYLTLQTLWQNRKGKAIPAE
jgi:hypothetical protein